MSITYQQLAERRTDLRVEGYFQPEDFGYDFRDWVSPYTKGACKHGKHAIVLQDWASERGLLPYNPLIAAHGRNPKLKTNDVLANLLCSVLEKDLEDVYATNVFPLVKPGDMSAAIPQRLANQMALEFTVDELKIAGATLVLALGKVAQRALRNAGVRCVELPHPAARGLNLKDHERLWREALG